MLNLSCNVGHLRFPIHTSNDYLCAVLVQSSLYFLREKNSYSFSQRNFMLKFCSVRVAILDFRQTKNKLFIQKIQRFLQYINSIKHEDSGNKISKLISVK